MELDLCSHTAGWGTVKTQCKCRHFFFSDMKATLCVLALGIASVVLAATPVNMNGDYLIANGNSAAGVTFESDYGKRGFEYFGEKTALIVCETTNM